MGQTGNIYDIKYFQLNLSIRFIEGGGGGGEGMCKVEPLISLRSEWYQNYAYIEKHQALQILLIKISHGRYGNSEV